MELPLRPPRRDTLFHKLVRACGANAIRRRGIEVRFRRRVGNPFLPAADYPRMRPAVPWLGDRALILGFP